MIAALSLTIWLYLLFAHGKFWRSTPQLPAAEPREFPQVDIIVPARDEAATIAAAIASLRAQDYAGPFRIIVVDDESSDGTAALAGTAPNLLTLRGQPKPEGWSGKLWALHQGAASSRAPLLLFTDADIVHDPRHLSSLIARLQLRQVQMVSEMVRLQCTSRAERALIPAFVFFFQMLYPFAKVNDPRSATAAAAGGTILIRSEALARCGGIGAIKSALIDDVALARAIKACGPIELSHSGLAVSVRSYPRFVDIWRMIARTAFTQLRYSPLWLALTVAGMALLWWVPVWAMIWGRGWQALCGLATVALAAASYLPTLDRYGRSRLWAAVLPLIALFYMAATLGSALDHWTGRGARWKSRAYARGSARR